MIIKYFISALLISLILPLTSHASEGGTKINKTEDNICKSDKWLKGWKGFKEAYSLRKENSCRTFVYFRSDFCAPCKILKKKIFNENEFYKKSSNVTKVTIDFPGSWQERRIAEKLGVIGTPAIFVMSNGELDKSETTELKFHTINNSRNGFKVATIDEALELINPSKQ